MKPKMYRRDLVTKDDIWNAVIATISEYDYPTRNQTADETFLAFYYYSEIESGGHEILMNWFSGHVEEVGVTSFLDALVGSLEAIGAYDYAAIERKYGRDMWQKFKELENGEIEEEGFYAVIEQADKEYDQLDGRIGELLETYFVDVHMELIDVIQD
ncbi:hypothetical protein [Planomicrobium sp. CPCC 101079]|uniref:DMP19 family protein n=1 Tax=Planomicrobium sp. CPCC 101079 TaxID=2599618 RepID=UPI0011B62DDE|nr:hypothetical protein [Planomicrobium sp. CPCC 101079]TWT01452.1 hypothetical protein FQV28_15360 [Planomicrobium sp. CPCC 101079]